MAVALLELLHILLTDVLEVLYVEEQAEPQLKLDLRLVILELLLPDLRDVEIVVEHSLDELFAMFFGPVEAFLGVEVGVVEGVILVADLWSRQCTSHELSITLVIYLRAFHQV